MNQQELAMAILRMALAIRKMVKGKRYPNHPWKVKAKLGSVGYRFGSM